MVIDILMMFNKTPLTDPRKAVPYAHHPCCLPM